MDIAMCDKRSCSMVGQSFSDFQETNVGVANCDPWPRRFPPVLDRSTRLHMRQCQSRRSPKTKWPAGQQARGPGHWPEAQVRVDCEKRSLGRAGPTHLWQAHPIASSPPPLPEFFPHARGVWMFGWTCIVSCLTGIKQINTWYLYAHLSFGFCCGISNPPKSKRGT